MAEPSVSKEEGRIGDVASWFETALTRLLTMRVGGSARQQVLILRSRHRLRWLRLEGWPRHGC
ncbi:hypothetical protein BRAS3843_1570006 [Bradyrhizobium sp. STM 3843]|nr:hypothetical protein BRAS3843_1570006 [Bradyrhizobium sp. STM 3843]